MFKDTRDEEEQQYLPYRIYSNLSKFFEIRKLDLVSGAQYIEAKSSKSNMLSQEEFIKNIQYYGYIQLECKDSASKDRRFKKNTPSDIKSKPVKTFILLLDQGSVYAKTTPQFAKLLERLPGFNDAKRNFNMDVIVISKEELNVHLQKKLTTSETDGDPTKGYIHITPVRYSMFSTIKLDHKLIPPHKIMPKSEATALLQKLMVIRSDLPKIRKLEPITFWLGAEIGDVIDIDEFSEATAIEKRYRVVRA
jgi:DNA-directed RNA polymerase subunit H (RpoH/RPB5)